jgi:hypothetical protein
MYGAAKYKKALRKIKEDCASNGHLGGFLTSA